jgi:hypothetical protein
MNSMLLITSGQKFHVHNHKIEIFGIYLEKYDAFKKIRILNWLFKSWFVWPQLKSYSPHVSWKFWSNDVM